MTTSWWNYFTNNDVAGLRQAILSGQVSPNAVDGYGNSILANATARGQLTMVIMLVMNGASIPDTGACGWIGKQTSGASQNDISIIRSIVCNGQIDAVKTIDWQKPLIAKYRIYPGLDWGSAPQYVKNWFNNKGLFTTSNPIYGDPCFWWPLQYRWYGIQLNWNVSNPPQVINWGSAFQGARDYITKNANYILNTCNDPRLPNPYLNEH